MIGKMLSVVTMVAAGTSASIVGTSASVVKRQPVAALHRLRGGGGEPEKTGKVWTLNTFTRDHCRIASHLPSYLGSYIGPNMLDAKTIELVMLTVNSINTCPFCTVGAVSRSRRHAPSPA